MIWQAKASPGAALSHLATEKYLRIIHQQEDSFCKRLNAFILLLTSPGLNARGIKSDENGIKEVFMSATSFSPFSLLFHMWG